MFAPGGAPLHSQPWHLPLGPRTCAQRHQKAARMHLCEEQSSEGAHAQGAEATVLQHGEMKTHRRARRPLPTQRLQAPRRTPSAPAAEPAQNLAGGSEPQPKPQQERPWEDGAGVWHRRAGAQPEPAHHPGRISREPTTRRQAPKLPHQIETGAQAGDSPWLGGDLLSSTTTHRGGAEPLRGHQARIFVPTFLHLSFCYPGVFPVQRQEEWSLAQSRKQHLPRAASPIRAGPVLLFLSPTAPFSLVTLFCYYSAHSFLLRGCGSLLLEGCHLHFLDLFSTAPFFLRLPF